MDIQAHLDGIAAKDIPGLAVAVFDGRESREYYAGIECNADDRRVTRETRFPIGCIAKLLVDIVLLQLISERKMGVDTMLVDALRTEDGKQWRGLGLSIGHLLSHTGGYREPRERESRWNYSWDRLSEYMESRPRHFAPGDVWSYSQVGHAALARAIEAIEGRSMLESVTARILDPLGISLQPARFREHEATPHVFSAQKGKLLPLRIPMKDGILDWSVSSRTMSAAHILSLGRAIIAASGSIVPDDVKPLLLNRNAVIEAQAAPPGAEELPVGYSLGLAMYRDGLFGHNGSFVGSTIGLLFDVASQCVVVVALNCWRHDVRDHLAFGTMAMLRGRTMAAPPPPLLTRPLSDLQGDYTGLMMSADLASIDTNNRCSISLSLGISEATLVERSGRLMISGSSSPVSVGPILREDNQIVGLRIGMSAFSNDRLRR